MRGVRVRWAGAAKVAAIAVTAVIALQVLPELLKPPAPPPLAEDVGLPRVVPKDAEPELHQLSGPATRKVDAVRKKRAQGRQAVGAARAVIGSEPRRRERAAAHPVTTQPPPAPEPPPYSPPAAPVAAPPPPPPAPVGDGSEEFAPH